MLTRCRSIAPPGPFPGVEPRHLPMSRVVRRLEGRRTGSTRSAELGMGPRRVAWTGAKA